MCTESNAMSDRILKDLETIIENDSEIEEFVIIPTEGNVTNKSPILYRDHNIGLESWCVKHIYQYSCSGVFYYRPKLAKRNIPFHLTDQLNRLLMGALLITPENHTFWNMKRELVEMDVLQSERELYFSSIVLSQKCKTNEVFAYRRWLLRRLRNKFSYNNLEFPVNLLQSELAVIHRCSEKAPNNYHSWNHRIWCIENIASEMTNFQAIMYAELNYSQEWINGHVSEHSGFHHRQYLITLLSQQKHIGIFESYYSYVLKKVLLVRDDIGCTKLLQFLLGNSVGSWTTAKQYAISNYICVMLYDLNVFVDQLNVLFPEHEAIFYHRRFLIFHLLKLSSQFNSQSPNSVQNCAVDSNKHSKFFRLAEGVGGCNLHRIVMNGDEKFCNQNVSVVQVEKYKMWFNNIISNE